MAGDGHASIFSWLDPWITPMVRLREYSVVSAWTSSCVPGRKERNEVADREESYV
jgi:hypothetical protein